MQGFASRLQQYREHLGLNPTDFAKKAGLSPQNINQWESALGSPSARKLLQLYQAFPKLNRQWLETGTGAMEIAREAGEGCQEVRQENAFLKNEVDKLKIIVSKLESEMDWAKKYIRLLEGSGSDDGLKKLEANWHGLAELSAVS